MAEATVDTCHAAVEEAVQQVTHGWDVQLFFNVTSAGVPSVSKNLCIFELPMLEEQDELPVEEQDIFELDSSLLLTWIMKFNFDPAC